ncbi:MAG: DUF3089 domain-containing protein [Endomicrobium sp.]|jgi:pimeloyl-ACP methyl ester carboxylesterase|nr:DUF3089 domain-containing protein [Endomicrobium sp.]
MFRGMVFVLLCLIFCIATVKADKDFRIPLGGDKISPADYSNTNNWLSLPKKLSKSVDVFFIYPTAWRANGEYPIADINNAEMRKWANYYLQARASAFAQAGDIYAPFYRQLDASFAFKQTKGAEGILAALKFFQGVPKTDIIAAFDYYIKHYNKGRPFILAGHSQGSIMIREILFDYMKSHPEVYKRMIAAYAIGVPMRKEDYAQNPHVKPAQNADDIGVVISYNTEAPKVDGANTMSIPNAILINPINWKTTEDIAPASQNLGSMIVNADGSFKKAPHLADAKINNKRGTIICSTVDREQFSSPQASRAYFPLGVFHENDIPLYYYNLQENAVHRVKQYMKQYK